MLINDKIQTVTISAKANKTHLIILYNKYFRRNVFEKKVTFYDSVDNRLRNKTERSEKCSRGKTGILLIVRRENEWSSAKETTQNVSYALGMSESSSYRNINILVV